jgi:hypothetical protein
VTDDLRKEFVDHMNLCARCAGDDAPRCWQMRDLLMKLAVPNEPYVTPIYPPNPQIDGDFPPLRLVTCPFCLATVKLERRGGMTALGTFTPPYYVEGRPEHKCVYDVPRKEQVKKSAKPHKRAPVTWSRGLFSEDGI